MQMSVNRGFVENLRFIHGRIECHCKNEKSFCVLWLNDIQDPLLSDKKVKRKYLQYVTIYIGKSGDTNACTNVLILKQGRMYHFLKMIAYTDKEGMSSRNEYTFRIFALEKFKYFI